MASSAECNLPQVTEIFAEVRPMVRELMSDVFGNYVVQKILEKGTDEQKDSIAIAIRDRAVELSHHTYGCRIVQKALEVRRSCKPYYTVECNVSNC